MIFTLFVQKVQYSTEVTINKMCSIRKRMKKGRKKEKNEMEEENGGLSGTIYKERKDGKKRMDDWYFRLEIGSLNNFLKSVTR